MEKGYINFVFTPTYNGKPAFDFPSIIFYKNKKSTWFDDTLVKKIIKGIDRADVLYQEALLDRDGKGISTEMLSNGCKSLICMRMLPTYTYCLSYVGDNCLSYMYDIAASGVTIDVFCDSPPYRFYPKPTVNLMAFNDVPIQCFDDFLDQYDDWWAEEVKRLYEK